MRKKGAALTSNEVWERFLIDLETRWPERGTLNPLAPEEKQLEKALAVWENLGILQEGQRNRIESQEFRDLSSADQDRLKKANVLPRDVTAWRVPRDHPLHLHNGYRLVEGRLGVQVVFERHKVVCMNIQIHGTDLIRKAETYVRIDLDPIQMGVRPGDEPVAHVIHRLAHCHVGTTPEADDAEEHDPRIPVAGIDPLRAFDYLLLQFFPRGHRSVKPRAR